MSINCLLTNDVILEKLAVKIGGGGGGGLPAPLITNNVCAVNPSGYFDAGSNMTFVEVDYVNLPSTALFSSYTQTPTGSPQLTTTIAITVADKPSFSFYIPTTFELVGTYTYPVSAYIGGGVGLICSLGMSITPNNVSQCLATVNIIGLACGAGTTIQPNLPFFTLYNGM